jgi:hypothetical protein
MNLSELKNKVIQKLRERPTPRHWSEDEITENINEGVREFCRRVECRRQLLPAPLIDAARASFEMPLKIVGSPHVFFRYNELIRTTTDYLDSIYQGRTEEFSIGVKSRPQADWRSETGATPTHWMLDEGAIRLFPIPENLSSVGNVRKFQNTNLAAGTTTITFTDAIPGDQANIDLYLRGVYQNKDQWSITGEKTIEMVGSLAVDAGAEIVHFDTVPASTELRTFKYVKTLPAGTTSIFVPRPYVPGTNAVDLKINGVSQAPSEFTEATTRIITIPALVVESDIEIKVYEPVSFFDVKVKCMTQPVDMENDTDTPDMPDHLEAYHDAIWKYALFECFSREGQEKDMNMAGFYNSRFESVIARYKDAFDPPILIEPRDAWRV